MSCMSAVFLAAYCSQVGHLQEQQENLKHFLKHKMRLPIWVSSIMGLIPAVLNSQAASLSANQVRSTSTSLAFPAVSQQVQF